MTNVKELRKDTKIRIFNRNIKAVLLFGPETWRITVVFVNKIQTFINNCLRHILKIFWPKTISNSELWERTNQMPVDEEILERRWRWLGHTLRKPPSNITRQALTWNPPGKGKEVDHVTAGEGIWRQMLKYRKELEKTAQDRVVWRQLVGGLCPKRGKRPK